MELKLGPQGGLRILPGDTPLQVVRDLKSLLVRSRDNAKVLAGKAPTRVEQARIETLSLVIDMLASVSVAPAPAAQSQREPVE